MISVKYKPFTLPLSLGRAGTLSGSGSSYVGAAAGAGSGSGRGGTLIYKFVGEQRKSFVAAYIVNRQEVGIGHRNGWDHSPCIHFLQH